MKIAVLFNGYGSQYVGMGKEFYDQERIVQEYFEEASNCLNSNFVKLCFASSDNDLSKMSNAYPAIFLMNSDIMAVLAQEGIIPLLMGGYNDGIISAMHAATGISFPDGLYLLNKYTHFYQEFLDTTTMKAVRVIGALREVVEDACYRASDEQSSVYVALYEEPDHCVIAGHSAAVDKARELIFEHKGAQTDDVSLAFGLHSRLMEPVVGQLSLYLEKIDFKNVTVPLIASDTGRVLMTGAELKEHVIGFLSTPLHWHYLSNVLDLYDIVIQIGDGNGLEQRVKRLYPHKQVITVTKRSDIDSIQKLITTPE